MRSRPCTTLQSPGTAAQGPLAAEIAALGPWFHNLHLPDGEQTAPDHPLGDFPQCQWDQIALSFPDLRGVRALDIGCNAGFYAFELARRGADVLAIDADPHYLRQASWATPHMPGAERIRFEQTQIYALAHRRERFDLVLFMGVLYHLRYPLLALDLVARLARDRLVIQSLSLLDAHPPKPPRSLAYEDLGALDEPGWPKMAFIEHALAGDPTNWWVPNAACMEAMMRSAGLVIESRAARGLYVCRRGNGRTAEGDQYAAALGVAASASASEPTDAGRS